MRSAVIDRAGAGVKVVERERPKPGPDDALVRVRACGVCHGDLMVREGHFPFARYPIVPGHEIAGTVEAVGDRVKNLKAGARVGLSALFSSCGECPPCRAGDEFLCGRLEFAGVTKDGGFQEAMIAPAAYLAPLPAALDFADAAPLMCAGLTVFSGMRHAGHEPGSKVAVIGLGGLGHMAVLFAKAMGSRVAVVSTSAAKETQARELGAERFVAARGALAGEALAAWDGGADLVIATSPDAETMSAAVSGLAGDGTMLILGAPGAPLVVPAVALIMGRRRIMGSPAGSRKDLADTLAFAAEHGIRPRTRRVPLDRLDAALTEMGSGHMDGRTVVVME